MLNRKKTKLQEGKAAKALRLKALVTKMNQKRVVTNLMIFVSVFKSVLIIVICG
jgi:hypothetical protein